MGIEGGGLRDIQDVELIGLSDKVDEGGQGGMCQG